jgi:YVTN family beta-propeller protein
VLAFRTDTFEQVARIPVGDLPHGIWPSGDGTRVYVGIENGDMVTAIDTLQNKVVATIPIGQAAQALVYVPSAVTAGEGLDHLEPLGTAGKATHFALGSPGAGPTTRVALFDQGLTQVLQAAVTGLEAKQAYVLALSSNQDGTGPLEPLASFMTNPAGAAVVDAVGPIRQLVQGEGPSPKRYLVIVSGTPAALGAPVQVQLSQPASANAGGTPAD